MGSVAARDRALRRISETTRAVAVVSVAMTAAFTALIARAQPGHAKSKAIAARLPIKTPTAPKHVPSQHRVKPAPSPSAQVRPVQHAPTSPPATSAAPRSLPVVTVPPATVPAATVPAPAPAPVPAPAPQPVPSGSNGGGVVIVSGQS